MSNGIIAIGTANPRYKRKQNETAELITNAVQLKPAEKRLLKSIYKASGIEERYSVLSDYCKLPGQFEFFPNQHDLPFPSTSQRMQIYKANALGLALQAIENCFARLSDVNKNQITHVITVSCTGMYAPGLDIEIVQSLNLSSNTKRFAINFMGCYGAFNAIKMADAICRADSHATVLIVCIELCTIHFQNKFSIENMIANSIFADGAAAALIQSVSTSTSKKHFSLDAFYCDLLPQTEKEMAWEIADNGFDIVLSSYVPEVIQFGIKAFLENILKQTSFAVSQIDLYAIHPGGIKILQACEKALGITEKENQFSYDVLKKFGNMSSATILFVLKNMWDYVSETMTNKTIFSCAFGPGLTLESMLLRIKINS